MTGIGTLLGLDVTGPGSLPALRVSLTLLAVVWAWLSARTRPAVSLAAGILWAACGIGFWVLYLGRPWGLFDDVATVRRAAETAVVAATGRPTEGVLTTTPAGYASWTAWLGRGISAETLILLPSVLPLILVPVVALALFVLVRQRERAWLAAVIWLLLSTGDLDTLRGLGLLPGLWSQPGAGLGFLTAALLALMLARLPMPPAVGAGVCAMPGLAAAALTGPGPDLSPGSAVLALTFDQGLLLVLAAVGFARHRDPAASGLVLGGALGVVAGLAVPGLNVWPAHAGYRLGLILAATDPLLQILERAGEWLAAAARIPRVALLDARRLGTAALVLALAPASFVTWWTPSRLDPLVEASRRPLPAALTDATDWIRQATPPDAVFLASDEQAPVLAILGARRLLRAPRLFEPPDDARRADAEHRLLRGRRQRDWVQALGVRYIFAAPGEFTEIEAGAPGASVAPHGRRLVYSNAKGYRVYEIVG